MNDLHWGGIAMWIGRDDVRVLIEIVIIEVRIADAGRDDAGLWLDAARRRTLADAGVALENTLEVDSCLALDAHNARLARRAIRAPRAHDHCRLPDRR